ncbi:hypothetical protein BS50DRAFT_55894 [Corynespora cassiicola Philippines]|uniref:Uncharacterized protein n=1 Tax=Corynespora cassiicola Philippines TaxID=1448308 RepID=A0A2T2NIW3_CORCC|nr:hypothetical protein BS50DRAFT_55894 [Corynespora cassiicola Philippines]
MDLHAGKSGVWRGTGEFQDMVAFLCVGSLWVWAKFLRAACYGVPQNESFGNLFSAVRPSKCVPGASQVRPQGLGLSVVAWARGLAPSGGPRIEARRPEAAPMAGPRFRRTSNGPAGQVGRHVGSRVAQDRATEQVGKAPRGRATCCQDDNSVERRPDGLGWHEAQTKLNRNRRGRAWRRAEKRGEAAHGVEVVSVCVCVECGGRMVEGRVGTKCRGELMNRARGPARPKHSTLWPCRSTRRSTGRRGQEGAVWSIYLAPPPGKDFSASRGSRASRPSSSLDAARPGRSPMLWRLDGAKCDDRRPSSSSSSSTPSSTPTSMAPSASPIRPIYRPIYHHPP